MIPNTISLKSNVTRFVYILKIGQNICASSVMIDTNNNNFLATWILGCGGCCLCSRWRRLPAVVIAYSGTPVNNPGAVLRGLILTWARYILQK